MTLPCNCFFCGKAHTQVPFMVAGDNAPVSGPYGFKSFICSECVMLSAMIGIREMMADRAKSVGVFKNLEAHRRNDELVAKLCGHLEQCLAGTMNEAAIRKTLSQIRGDG